LFARRQAILQFGEVSDNPQGAAEIIILEIVTAGNQYGNSCSFGSEQPVARIFDSQTTIRRQFEIIESFQISLCRRLLMSDVTATYHDGKVSLPGRSKRDFEQRIDVVPGRRRHNGQSLAAIGGR